MVSGIGIYHVRRSNQFFLFCFDKFFGVTCNRNFHRSVFIVWVIVLKRRDLFVVVVVVFNTIIQKGKQNV